MSELEKYKEDIHKCSKCGLCQAVCPIYKETGNDCSVSRGLIIMLKGVIKGDLKLNKNINKYLEKCLKCGKCLDFCPSDIDIIKIITCAKYKYFQQTVLGKIFKVINLKFVFNLILTCISFVIRLFLKEEKSLSAKTKVLYFKGCVNKIYPKTYNSSVRILNKHNIEIVPIEFECCGLPFYSAGDLDSFVGQAKFNLDKIQNLEFDYILTDCDSCNWTLRLYKKYITEPNYVEKINLLESKLKSIQDLISDMAIPFKFSQKYHVTVHKPCHSESIDNIEKIINNCQNLEYTRLEDLNSCCGFAGLFGVKNRKLSLALSEKKAQDIQNTNAEIVLTTCPSCILGLKQGTKGNAKIMNLIEFLDMAE